MNIGTKDLSAPELIPNLQRAERHEEPMDVFYGYDQDIWALGLLLYTMIHGALPKENASLLANALFWQGHVYYPTSFSSDLEPQCLLLLQKMLSIDVKSRLSAGAIVQHRWLQFK